MGGRKVNLEVIEDHFSGQLPIGSELSILIGMDSLAYMVTDASRQLLALRGYQLLLETGDTLVQQVEALLQQDAYLRSNYEATRVALPSRAFTLVPDRLYNPLEKPAYLQALAIAPTATETLRTDDLPACFAKNIYIADSPLLNVLGKYLPSARCYHDVTAWLIGLMRSLEAPSGYRVYLQVYPGTLQLALLEGTQLLFVNAFSYQSAKDFLYYTLLLFDQFNLEPTETPVFMCGWLIENSEVYPMLFRYLEHLHFLPPPPYLQLGPKWSKQPAYFFHNLFGLVCCP